MPKTFNTAGLVVLAVAGMGLIYSSRETQAPVATATTSIFNVRVFDGTGVVENATVVFDERGIVSKCAGCPAPKGVRTIDGAGKTQLPGLIDAHSKPTENADSRIVWIARIQEPKRTVGFVSLESRKSQESA